MHLEATVILQLYYTYRNVNTFCRLSPYASWNFLTITWICICQNDGLRTHVYVYTYVYVYLIIILVLLWSYVYCYVIFILLFSISLCTFWVWNCTHTLMHTIERTLLVVHFALMLINMPLLVNDQIHIWAFRSSNFEFKC